MTPAQPRRAVDVAWIVAGALILLSSGLQMMRWFIRGGAGRAGAVDWILFAVGLVALYWIVAGCWRRTSWLRRRYEARATRKS